MDNHEDEFTQYSNNIEECNHDMHSDSDLGSVNILDDGEEKGRDTNEVGVCETPILGMVFDNDEDAYEYYNSYARSVGFSVRKQRLNRNKKGVQIGDKSFFYAIRTNSENEICGCFFCDGKSRRDYAIFGDAICFDTTFKMNNYNMVCAPIVGVNNHGQSLLFGCGLLDGETTEACKWLFNVFLQAMEGKEPETVFIDQAQAIAAAISEVLPNYNHRLCLWHIFQNAAKRLSQVFNEFKTFSRDFKKCVYHPETVEEFESNWQALLDDYGLGEIDWLEGLYKLREKWTQVYARSHFCSAIGDRREKKRLVETTTKQTKRNLFCAWNVEDEASKLYTRKIFHRFQDELKKLVDWRLEFESDDGVIRKYKAVKLVTNNLESREIKRTVIYIPSTQSVNCSCRKFEFVDILCAHALKLFREL
ncbi:hypothetical protein EZV62_006698 [Acer yangbiense]|uniref:Protein FAR1-RELATED SEQUENCE n=1 Tax=Acer yangbiense TaxID=1000413 RepID=A0A5C7I773_9ROSI|nr:hypothetical protein EZV62_006698 [Acer yangbiense]